jgi:hypothetical protein
METKSVKHNFSVTEKSEYWALYYREIIKLNIRDYNYKAFFVEFSTKLLLYLAVYGGYT